MRTKREGKAIMIQRDKTFVRRDLETEQETILLEGETVDAVALSRGGGRWMTTGSERGLRLWDTTKWQLANSATNAPFDKWPALKPGLSAFDFYERIP